jgi:branched-chain amino acid transport system ATP-binding protein
MSALLELDGVSVFYGLVQALRDVTLHINEGERVALLGINGAGKSTTLRAASGMQAPRRGDIRINGKQVRGRAPYEIVQLGLAHVPEGRQLFAGMTVEENLQLGFAACPPDKKLYAERRDMVLSYFPILGERAKQASGTLSGGEQQMLVVARGLMSGPRLLLVDELSLGLAPLIVDQLFEILKRVNENGTAVLIVEQFIHRALANTDRAYVLRKGQIIAERPSAELLADEGLIASYLGGEGAVA